MEKEISKTSKIKRLPNGEVEVDSENLNLLCTLECDQYDESKTFSEELKTHDKKLLWVFEYSEEVNRKTQERYDNLSKNDQEQEITSPKETGISTEIVSDDLNSVKILQDYKTPHSGKRQKASQKLGQLESDILDTTSTRNTPLPLMSWADSEEIWQNMIYKEEATLKMRNSKLFHIKSNYLPRMRAILLDWIMEVCEVYHLRRVTYYLSVDYIDRYLTIKPTVPKTQLQLLGISCLFIAAKLEEIYPPKLTEFSYVCDGACTEDEILSCEVLILNTLGWDVNPMTASGWLNLYMQIHYNAENLRKQKLHEGVSSTFQFPQYSAYEFIKASHLIDLFSMDPGFLKFSYSIIAAGAMHYVFGKDVALTVSGLSWLQLASCVEYMSVFNQIIDETVDPRLQTVTTRDADERQLSTFRAIKKKIPELISDENHCLQTHIIDLQYFERATMLRLNKMGLTMEDLKSEDSYDSVLESEEDKEDKQESPLTSEQSLSSETDGDQNTEENVMLELEKILEDHICSIDQRLTSELSAT